ncbi:MAG: ribonuclease D [Sphingobacteriia bacterium]|nr:ribonuclease D [Sphingobacteriia bacterium]
MSIFLHKNDLPNDFKINGDIAIDTEAMGLNNHRDRLCLLQFSNGNGEVHLVQFVDKKFDCPNLKKLLSDPKRTKILHYARFDVAIIKKYLDVLLEPIYCTKIASKLIRTYTDQHSLKELCKDLVGVTLSKAQRSSDWGADELSEEQLQYAASDVLYLHQIKEKLDVVLKRENRDKLAQKCFEFLPTQAELDLLGFGEDIFMH